MSSKSLSQRAQEVPDTFQSMYWCFTSFDLTRDYTHIVTAKRNVVEPSYCIYGLETCPDTKNQHHQGYLEFPRKLTKGQLRKYWVGLNVSPRYGTAKQAADYCRKEAKFVTEFGVISDPHQGARTDIVSLKDAVLAGGQVRHVMDIITNVQHLRFAEGLVKYSKQERDWVPDVYWYYGPSGTGKTVRAFDEARAQPEGKTEVWCSAEDLKWWDGYSGEKHVILDDFRGSHVQFSTLLRILDSKPFRVPIKGSMAPLLARKIWITSPYHPSDVYSSEKVLENLNQLIRRISFIDYMGAPGSYPDVTQVTAPVAATVTPPPSLEGDACANSSEEIDEESGDEVSPEGSSLDLIRTGHEPEVVPQ